MNLYLSFLILIFGFRAFGQSCAFTGATLRNPGKTQKNYATINQAVRNAISGAEIEIGSATDSETINVVGKENLSIASVCGSTIEGMVIKKSQNIAVANLNIRAVKGPAIVLAGSDQANSSIILKNLSLTPKLYMDTSHGIHIGESTQGVIIDSVDIRSFPLSGIFIDNMAKEVVISHSKIENNQRHGIVLSGNVDLNITDSFLQYNGTSSFVGKSAGFGLAISKSADSKIDLKNTSIAFNFGCVERSYACDISNPSFITSVEKVTTTYGREREGLASVVIGTAGPLNPALESYLAQVDLSLRPLLRAFITHAIFATKSEDKVSKGYSSIRENQLKTCLVARNPSGTREQIIDVLDLASGKDMNAMIPFLARYDGVKLNLPVTTVPDQVCSSFHRIFR